MSNTQENGLSSYIVDTVLKAVRDNTIGGVVDNYTLDGALSSIFSNLSKITSVIIGETLVKHFNITGDVSKIKELKAVAFEVVATAVNRTYLEKTIAAVAENMPTDGVRQQV